jgi:4-hydroxy-tetrahydrodipicolinate synthase
VPRAADAKEWAFEHLKGIGTSPLTVFHEDFSLDDEGLAFNTSYLIEKLGVNTIGYGHGEPWSLSHQERMHSAETFLTAATKERAAGRQFACYVHSFDHSAPDTADLTNHAADHGADLVMIEPPYEHAKSEQHILEFFKYVAAHTDLGIILLNTPHSGRIMPAELLSALSDIPAVCALKNGINDWVTTQSHWQAVHDRIVFSHPRDEEFLSCMMYLDQQVILGSTAICLLQAPDWQPIRRAFDLARQKDFVNAFAIWAAMGPARDLWSEMHSVLWGDAPEHPIAWSKAWMEVVGMRGGPMRPPNSGLSDSVRQAFQERARTVVAEVRRQPIFSGPLFRSPAGVA